MQRRTFITGTASTVVSAVAAPAMARAASEASRHINVAVMGMGGRGTTLASELEALPDVDVKAVYDVDRVRAEHAAHVVGQVHGRTIQFGQDFRASLDDRDIDAVVIATSNHWHAPAAVMACTAGKHVYVEKPCSHNPREGELMVEASAKFQKRIQHGTQRRSRPGEREAIRLLHDGIIGRLYYAHCYYRSRRPSLGTGKSGPVPDYLDYELWQGPAPRRPYKDNLIHYNWHWHWHWGNGELGNNGVHRIDIARAALQVDYPIHVTSTGGRFHWQGDDQETPDTQIATFRFLDDKVITWEALSCQWNQPGDRREDIWFYGDGGSAAVTGTGYTIYDNQQRVIAQRRGRGGQKEHVENFVAAIRGENNLNAEISEGHKSTLLCHLGNIALRTGRALRCDPSSGQIIDDAEAMQFWSREYEPNWEPTI